MFGTPDDRGRLPIPTRPCPLCGLRAFPRDPGRFRKRSDPTPVRCRSCGLVFIDPLPDAAVRPETYGTDYYEPWQRPREERARIGLWTRRLHAVSARAQTGSLLDVGCGDGLFLKVARDSGWAGEGIEFSPDGARRAAHRLERPVALGDIGRDSMLHGPFDVITLWHVLEHLPDPNQMLDRVRERLRFGGLLTVAVPNLENLPMRAAYRITRLRPLPLYEPGAREPHLSHFSPSTLRLALVRHGFVDIEILPDLCALTPAKRIVDAAAVVMSRITGRLLTNAIVAFARRDR